MTTVGIGAIKEPSADIELEKLKASNAELKKENKELKASNAELKKLQK